MAEYAISNAYATDHVHVTHVYLEQRYLDIPVFNGILNLNLSGDQLVSFGNRWITGLHDRAPSPLPDITPKSAVERAAIHLGYTYPNAVEISREQNKLGQATKVIFDPGNISTSPIITTLMWIAAEEKKVLLCWKVEIAEINREDVWDVFIDAHTGTFIRKDNLVMHCSFDKSPAPYITDQVSKERMITSESVMPPTPDSSYNVFPVPIESPIHGSRSIMTRPWTLAGAGNLAVTLGWHNSGSTNYHIKRGNNVYAYEDINHDNIAGYSPDTFNLRFDYPFTPSIDPTDNLASCITNLFYWNNIMHDVMYQYGFNEVAGNFQNNNLGRGGLGADYVKAEAQDGGGTNNANFFTSADGSS